MANLKIQLFGKLSVRNGSGPLDGFEGRKAQELMSYLVLNRHRPQPRETLAGVLWSEASTERAKKYLRKALWQLQCSLEPVCADDEPPLLLVTPDWIQLNPKTRSWIDVVVFEEALAGVRGVAGVDLEPHLCRGLEEAVTVYRGELLEDWYHEWCLYERERFGQMFLNALEKLVDYFERHRRPETALVYAERILRLDRAHERTHRSVMRLLYQVHDRTGALRQYERCVDALEDELGVAPEGETDELYHKISRGWPVSGAAPATEMPAASLPDILSQLRHIGTVIEQAQHEVEQHIRRVEEIIAHQPRPGPQRRARAGPP